MPKQSLADLGVSAAVCAALAERGITKPFPVQELALPDALAGRDLLVESPTGSGKTLAFGLPLIERLRAEDPRPAALVLAPTRELASQIVDELYPVAHARALRITAVYGGVGIVKQVKEVGRAHIVVATPGRLEDLLERGALDLDRVRVLVLDEADRMLDMGFRPAVERIARRTPRGRQTLLFSATLGGAVADLAARYTRDPATHTYRPEGDRALEIEHRFVRVAHERKLATLLTELASDDVGRALVFVRTKRGADRLVKRIGAAGVKAVAMHGDRSQAQREKALAAFEDGRVRTLVATDVAARGIDVRDVTHVINFDAPEDHESYVHRVGRTARAGASGVGVTFWMTDQEHTVGAIARALGLEREFGGVVSKPKPKPNSAGRRPSRRGGRPRTR